MLGVTGFDLHTHSSISDGTQTPAELVQAAVDAGLEGIALTDHDTTSGWAEARRAAAATGLGLIPGLELSTRQGWRSVHLLGYLVDPDEPGLVAETERVRGARLERAQRIVGRLGEDHPITWDDVLAQTAPGATIGRPHIADALVALGIESDRSAAFAGLLHPRAGYVELLYAPTPVDGVRLIVEAGGVPVLAHPGATVGEHVIDAELVGEMVDAGLFALELNHPENVPSGRARAAKIAAMFDLPVTGSSDYHGAGKPNRIGEHTTAPDVVARILELGTGATPTLAAARA